MHQIQEEIEIDASVEKVWDILADMDGYPKWNSFVLKSQLKGSGTLAEGTPITISVAIKKDGKASHYDDIISKFEPGKELRWRGYLGSSMLLSVEHYFAVSPGTKPNSCHFLQGETFTGLLVGLVKLSSTFDDLKAAYRRMNQELKQHAEQS